jgi:hypothetical protein
MELTVAYEKVRSDNDPLTWLLLDYEVSPRPLAPRGSHDVHFLRWR